MKRIWSSPAAAGCLAGVLCATVLLSHYAFKYGLNVAPATSGDELSYDIIGWNLSQGLGFSEGGYTPEFREIYNQSANAPVQMSSADPHAVAYRPPVFPGLLSVLNLTIGRQFHAVRVWNVLAIATTAGLLVALLLRSDGRTAAVVGFLLFLVVDTRTRLYGRAILTEATATLLMSLVTLLLIQLAARQRPWLPVILGLIFGALICTRTMFILWLPPMGLLLMVIVPGAPSHSDTANDGRISLRWRGRFASAAGFIAAAVLVVLPWSIRNIVQLERFMPLGTQGMMQLSAGFGPYAVQHNGVWIRNPELEIRRSLDTTGMTHLQAEVAIADISRRNAFRWMTDNPGRVITLAGWKIWQEYRPRSAPQWLIALCAVVGASVSLGRLDTRLFLALHAISALTFAATWSVEGRFLVPLMLSIHVLAARGVVIPLQLVFQIPESSPIQHSAD